MAGGADLNDVGVLRRREIEARIVAPLLDAFVAEFGRERVLAVAKQVIVDIARQQGRELAARCGGNDLGTFAAAKEPWTRNGSLEIQVVKETAEEYHFNVTRCRYAEMYRALGVPELGGLLSCNRDFALGEGFNPDLRLARTQTIMEGAPFCDFRYRLRRAGTPTPPATASRPRTESGSAP